MGRAKEYYYSQLDRGYFDIGEKYVCSNCFDDYAISDFIKEIVEKKKCDYCGRKSSKPIAAPIDEVLELIMNGIHSEWGHPEDEGVAWESREGGWQGKVIDSYDLIMDQQIIPTENEEILNDVIGAIEGNQWCQKDFYELPPKEVLKYGWSNFARNVKHSVRYFFNQPKDDPEGYMGHEEIPTHAMLDVLSNVILEANLIQTLKKGKNIFRVRIHDPKKVYSTAKELGPPKIAKYSNRMSPAGIAMFYGAFDPKTAMVETFEKGHKKPKSSTMATFKTVYDIRILDLTKLPGVPSLFDESKRGIRPGIMFLYSFVEDVSKPITKDGMEHIEYVPTQIFTEYFRHIFHDKDQNKIDGILYKSSKRNGGIACVLFMENKNCGDAADPSNQNIKLILQNTETKECTTMVCS